MRVPSEPFFTKITSIRPYFELNFLLKGKYPPQEIGYFWPFYGAILSGLGSLFLLFSENTLNLRYFPMKLHLYIPIKSPFWTKIWLKKGQNTPKSKGTPLVFLSYGGLLFSQFLPKRCLFCTNLSLKRGYFLQEIGHFWPFYRAILLGLGSLFLLFSEKCLKFTLFLHEIGFIYPYKKFILN
jgi:hypothetical protein